MFQPPEKGERATLNPNLSTRLNLLFSDQAFGRRVGYCWSTRASVPRVVLKGCVLIKRRMSALAAQRILKSVIALPLTHSGPQPQHAASVALVSLRPIQFHAGIYSS